MTGSNPDSSCIFCQIVAGKAPKAVIYEDDDFLAFLDIVPPTDLTTVVIPKNHQPSDFSLADPQVVGCLVKAAQVVVQRLKKADDQIERCVLNFEGLHVPHLHANLLPLRATDQTKWRTWSSLSTPLLMTELEPLADKIRQANS